MNTEALRKIYRTHPLVMEAAAEVERLRAALLAVVNGDYDIDAIPEEIWLQAKAALGQKADTE